MIEMSLSISHFEHSRFSYSLYSDQLCISINSNLLQKEAFLIKVRRCISQWV